MSFHQDTFHQEEKRGKEIIIKGRMGLQDYTAGDGSKKVHEYSEPFITDVLDRLIEIVKPTMVLPEYVNKVSDYEILGTIISKYVKWNSVALLEIFESASEDSNFSVIEIVFPKLPKNIQANLLKTGKHKRR